MARKESVTKNIIIETAFQMTREEGFSLVTARRLANRIGCSTQPIFRVYENMGELKNEIFIKSKYFFESFYDDYPKTSTVPFENLGLAYIQFAEKESKLFQLLFLSEDRVEKNLYELLNGNKGAVKKEIQRAAEAGCKDPSNLFMKMWIFIHGAACMSITGDYDLSVEETADLLVESYLAYSRN
ncbi:MAG TPA: TetR/AcrR family transcriptional regulator [Lachnospiraceae bacterium]|nr:TetR/AcrR family transcriptional regulator [Lachnospiraceae bacterium]